jgi:hypothetical protein
MTVKGTAGKVLKQTLQLSLGSGPEDDCVYSAVNAPAVHGVGAVLPFFGGDSR